MLKVGMFTSGYQRNPLEHCFMDAKEYGYDYIELWGGRPHAYAPDLKAGDINEVRRLIEKYEMPVLGYTPEHNAYPYNYMIGSEAQRRDAVDYLKLSLEMAKEMGAEFVLTSPANGGYLATYDQLWSRFDKLGNKMDHMHIIDGENGSDTHMIPGEGNIPIKEMLYEMKRIGYDKTATLELVTNYINEPRFYAKRAIDNMRELMAEAGIV